MSSPAASGSAAELALRHVDWEPVVFADAPGRLQLLRLRAGWPLEPVRLTVHRNRPIEYVASAARPFAAYAGFDLTFGIGAYDDSISGTGDPASAAELVWLDYGRYSLPPDELATWVAARAAERVRLGGRPVLVVDDDRAGDPAAALNVRLHEALGPVPGVRVVGLREIATRLGAAYRDERLKALAASDLTDRAAIEIGRSIAFEWVPVALRPRIKLVAVDLDNTLIDGVLGEDGIDGVRVGPARRAMQATLVDLAAAGVLVALVSRNEAADVEALLAAHPGMTLRRDALFAVEAGWGPKAEAIERVVARAHIARDAVLFVDDNPGELAAVAAALPGIRVLGAADAELAARALARYPGLHGYPRSREDALRARDLAAAEERLAGEVGEASRADYLRSLAVELRLRMDDESTLARAAELSGKTNQFNTALRRFTPADLHARWTDPASRIVVASLRDRLSDSGIIASVVATRREGVLDVEEVCVSCRALGRDVETPLILEAVLAAAQDLECAGVRFAVVEGPRNGPARAWLEGITPGDPSGRPILSVDTLAARREPDLPVTITWSTP